MKLLVLRFSAMGDVALLSPVLSALESKYASLSITLVTRKAFQPFFYNIPGVDVIGVDVDKEYRGLRGLYRLYKELRRLGPFDKGIDVHAVTRSRILKSFFRFSGLKFETIVKGRREKNQQTRRFKKILKPLPHVVDRYMHVFERAGFNGDTGVGPWINPDTHSRALAREFLVKNTKTRKENLWIGIAPFAGHEAKMWPLEYMRELLSMIQDKMNATIFLFGGGQKEIAILKDIQKNLKDSVLVAGELNLEGELAMMLRLDVMVAMDSSNMHLASLLGVPVISIWGTTHVYSGFGPYGQGMQNIVEIPPSVLPCRPCSIFGNKVCFRGDLACMTWITPILVFEKIAAFLKDK